MAKNATSTVTASDNNSTRRAVKARQHKLAKAKSAQRASEPQILSLHDIAREKSKHSHIQQIRTAEGDKAIKTVIERKVMVLNRPEGDEKTVRRWENQCYDVINAAKRCTTHRFIWEREWRTTGTFMITVRS